MIAFGCPHCGAQLRVKQSSAGQSGPCPHCSRVVRAPGAAGSASGQATVRPAAAGDTSPSDPELAAHPEYPFLAPPQGPDELGRLGPYVVRKVLGTGAMGVVFEAEDPHLRRPVALKVMRPSLAAHEEFHRRFLREAQLAAAIDHDHVVTIYQVGEDRGVPFLAMKLLRGESLEERLNRVKRLEVAEVLRIGREVAEGLAAAHERGLIHRDIKPANVWLEEGRDRVKILDFGLARTTAEDGRFTQAGAVIGTPHFMAPEQANGREVDGRCDLFSLGAVLYLASTGKLPFPGKDTLTVLSALATKTPQPPHSVDPSIPREFSDLVMSLLAKDRKKRPQSAEEVVSAIEVIETGQLIEEVPEPLEEVVLDEDPEEPAAPAPAPAAPAPSPSRKAKKARPPGERRKKRSAEGPDWGRRVLVVSLVLLGVAFLVFLVGIIRYAARGRGSSHGPTRAVPVARAEQGANALLARGACRPPGAGAGERCV